jgi:secondary thiamine-phosphate synthase enzyme
MAIDVTTESRVDVVDVTDRVRDAVPADVQHGVCTVFVRHTTAGVVVQEPESGLLEDVANHLEHLAPSDGDYAHDRIDDNADAHLRATVLGEHVAVPVRDGDLALGTWQAILFVECDGPRTRSLDVTVTPAVGGD